MTFFRPYNFKRVCGNYVYISYIKGHEKSNIINVSGFFQVYQFRVFLHYDLWNILRQRPLLTVTENNSEYLLFSVFMRAHTHKKVENPNLY